MPLPTKSMGVAIEGVVDKVQVKWKLRKANQKIEKKKNYNRARGVVHHLPIMLAALEQRANPRTEEGEAGKGSKVQGHPKVGSKLAADIFETPCRREDGGGVIG